MEEKRKKIINLMKLKREELGLSLRKLEALTGVSYATISRLEAEKVEPDDNTVVRIAKWLGDSVSDLDLPIAHVAEVHFRAAKNVDSKTIEALSEVAALVKKKKP